MKIILKSVTVNEVAAKEVTNKDTGELKVYRSVDIFIPRDKEDEYSRPKSISAKVIEGPIGMAVFELLLGMEGQKVTLEGNYTEEKVIVIKDAATRRPDAYIYSCCWGWGESHSGVRIGQYVQPLDRADP